MNRLVDIAVPEFNAMGGTRIVPGHGRITNEIDAVEYRDMLTIIRDRIARLVDEGRTLEQVKAARVSLDYDGVYGTTSGPWTTDAFIAAAFTELSAAAARDRSSRTDPAPGTRRTARGRRQRGAGHGRARRVAGAADPFAGTWVLDVARSRYAPSSNAPYRRETTIEIDGDAVRQSTSTWRRLQGNDSPLARVSYSARFDGKEYPVEASSSRVTLRRVDAATIERTASRRPQLEGDRHVDAVCRPAGVDDGDVRRGWRRRAVQQHAGVYPSSVSRAGKCSRDDGQCPRGIVCHHTIGLRRAARAGRPVRRGRFRGDSACVRAPPGRSTLVDEGSRGGFTCLRARRLHQRRRLKPRGGESGVSLARTMNRSGAVPT